MRVRGQTLDTLKPPASWPKPITFLWGPHTRAAHIREEPQVLTRDGVSRALCGKGFYREGTEAPFAPLGLCGQCERFAQTKFGWTLEQDKRGKR